MTGRVAERRREPPPAPARPAKAPRSWQQRLRIAAVVCAVLVLAVTGTAWGLYRDLTAGITTTDILGLSGGGGAQNILLVGVDSRTDAQGRPLPPEVTRELSAGPDTGVLNSDTIILLHVPEGGGAASAFSVPRDSYVTIPGLGRDKINAAYPVTKARTAERLVADGESDPARIEAASAQEGRAALVGAVEGLTGQEIDHYAEINLLGFYQLTKAIGGVDVCLRNPVSDELSGARFPAGPQTIAGRDALAFVRQRHGLPDGDLSRVRRQQVFLAAVADKILSGGVLTDPARLGALLDVARSSLVIDSGWDLLGFAQQAADIAAGNIAFETIPTRGLSTNRHGDVVDVDTREVSAAIEARIEEQARAAEAARNAPTPPPDQVDVIANRYVVDVRNGSTLDGVAAQVQKRMRALGFAYGTVATTEPAAESVVRYTGADGEAADAVAEQLGGLPTEKVDDVSPGHLFVVIGDDFDAAVLPPTATPAPAPATQGAPLTAAAVPCID